MIQYTQVEAHLLNTGDLLAYLEELPFFEGVDSTQVQHELFVSYHQVNRHQPDHLFAAKWHELGEDGRRRGLQIGPVLALQRLSEQFLEGHVDCFVKLPLFGYWQSLISRISPLPLQATFLANSHNLSVSRLSQYQWPLYPRHLIVEDYISREQLHESHQHLNGSSSAESCWLDALRRPAESMAKFRREYDSKPKLRQLCAQISADVTPDKLLHRLRLAGFIRKLLVSMACNREKDSTELNTKLLSDSPWSFLRCSPAELTEKWREIEMVSVSWPTRTPYSLDAEFFLVREIMHCFVSQPTQDPLVERLLWLYLLIQNQYLTLLVHRDDFYGFEQFQKYTFTELRELTEQEYQTRFSQVHGRGKKSQIGYLDARFAPKRDTLEFEKILTRILHGYANYIHPYDEIENKTLSGLLDYLENNPPSAEHTKLGLVVHFIKQPSKKDEPFPYVQLYENLVVQASIIIRLLKARPQLRQWIRGIDAAANELDAPPEIFAPIFRVLRKQGIDHATYHAGEDFVHMVSGIRAIYESVVFLGLGHGDRLGHCTAIGISPAIWRRSLPPSLTINQQTYLLDLIFIWKILRHHHLMLNWANVAASRAVKMAQKIFKCRTIHCIEQLDDLFSLRDIFPLYAPLCDESTWQLRASSVWDDEYNRVDDLLRKRESRQLVELYRLWLYDENVRKERNIMLLLDTSWLPDDALIALQQAVMKIIAKKNIAIECPPTSNTRISQYIEVKEHHIFRWMGLPEYVIDGDSPMSICLASDDPGIFATDLKSEFYHLFAVLTQQMNMSSHDALMHISRINENGRIFKFHP